jgi:hypothetical protein
MGFGRESVLNPNKQALSSGTKLEVSGENHTGKSLLNESIGGKLGAQSNRWGTGKSADFVWPWARPATANVSKNASNPRASHPPIMSGPPKFRFNRAQSPPQWRTGYPRMKDYARAVGFGAAKDSDSGCFGGRIRVLLQRISSANAFVGLK